MSEPIIEQPTYFELDKAAGEFIAIIAKIEPKAKVLVLIEDNVNSIIKQAEFMHMSDTLGLIHISLIRLDEHERQSFVNRINAARELENRREEFVNDQAKKGNVN
jgi:hypothetical protein